MAALALGWEARLLFTYEALDYLRRNPSSGCERDRREQITAFLRRAKRMGAEIYACVSSMASLNVTRDELVDEVEASTGLARFLAEAGDRILFV